VEDVALSIVNQRRSALARETYFFFDRFERVEHNRAITRAIAEVPHARQKAPVSPDRVREVLTIPGPDLVHQTVIAVEEHATLLGAPKDQTLIRSALGVVPREYAGR
jgi:hypothetical protein